MTIAAVRKVTCYVPLDEKEAFLRELQALGVMHRIPLRAAAGDEGEGPSAETRRAFRFLLATPGRRRQVHNTRRFDAERVERRALEIESRQHDLGTERDDLLQHIEALAPWGDFEFPEPGALGGHFFWFYAVPHYRLPQLHGLGHPWQVVGRDARLSYVVVLAPSEPVGMPVPRSHTGGRRLAELRARLEAVEWEMEDLEAERLGLTRWLDLFAASLDRLQDHAERRRAAEETLDDAQLFAIQGWVPDTEVERVRALARQRRCALTVEAPRADETPPTILRTAGIAEGGRDLVTFYLTPGYRLWDPSGVVLFSFAAFFALILADAGYAAAFAGIVGLFWRRLGRADTGRRLRRMLLLLAGAAGAWGVAVGSYFGVAPPEGSALAAVVVADPRDAEVMMRVSIAIGVGHLVLANLADAGRRWPGVDALAPGGWAVALVGATALWLGLEGGATAVWGTGSALLAGGAALVLLFAAPAQTPVRRLLRGLLALALVPRAFGDVLSYLRLFALGMATASLAVTFNDLATGVARASPGLGMLGALLILLVGHGLNFALAVMSGFVHGLRLNYIEFFNWGLPGEGLRYRPFARRERDHWTPSS